MQYSNVGRVAPSDLTCTVVCVMGNDASDVAQRTREQHLLTLRKLCSFRRGWSCRRRPQGPTSTQCDVQVEHAARRS